jgi:hypothetical protein
MLILEQKGREQIGQLGNKWEVNVSLNHKETGCEDGISKHKKESKAGDIINTMMNRRVPQKQGFSWPAT